ncbi:hypothetical protein JX266_013533 [Neoarthrinium moseri]|nr:hypothetical protein JX266_013533 [Neoarthrinium moseri]
MMALPASTVLPSLAPNDEPSPAVSTTRLATRQSAACDITAVDETETPEQTSRAAAPDISIAIHEVTAGCRMLSASSRGLAAPAPIQRYPTSCTSSANPLTATNLEPPVEWHRTEQNVCNMLLRRVADLEELDNLVYKSGGEPNLELSVEMSRFDF